MRKFMGLRRQLMGDHTKLLVVIGVIAYVMLVQMFFNAIEAQISINAQSEAALLPDLETLRKRVEELPPVTRPVVRQSTEPMSGKLEPIMTDGEALSDMLLRSHLYSTAYSTTAQSAWLSYDSTTAISMVMGRSDWSGLESFKGIQHRDAGMDSSMENEVNLIHIGVGGLLGLSSVNERLRHSSLERASALLREAGMSRKSILSCANSVVDPRPVDQTECARISLGALGSIVTELTYASLVLPDFPEKLSVHQILSFFLRDVRGRWRMPLEHYAAGSPRSPHSGLHNVFIEHGGHFSGPVTFSEGHGRFYDSLLKAWILGDKRDDGIVRTYDAAVEGLLLHLVRTTSKTYYTFSGYVADTFIPVMDYSSCFIPGMLILGVHHGAHSYEGRSSSMRFTANEVRQAAEDLAATCFRLHDESPRGLAPERVRFGTEDGVPEVLSNVAAMTPEFAESLFYLYRVTGARRYSEWGKRILETYNSALLTPLGFKLMNGAWNPLGAPMEEVGPAPSSFFATLSFLRLLFTRDDFSIDSYVLNARAQPFLIPGQDQDTGDAVVHETRKPYGNMQRIHEMRRKRGY